MNNMEKEYINMDELTQDNEKLPYMFTGGRGNTYLSIEDRISMLKSYIICLKCRVSPKNCDADCPIQYDAGNMGEIIDNLEWLLNKLERYTSDQTI